MEEDFALLKKYILEIKNGYSRKILFFIFEI